MEVQHQDNISKLATLGVEEDAVGEIDGQRCTDTDTICAPDDQSSYEGGSKATARVGGQPTLDEQLNALTLTDMEERLEVIGEKVRQPEAHEYTAGFKIRRRAELLQTLCAAYAARVITQPRVVVHDDVTGFQLSQAYTAPLLEAVRMMDWKENARPLVQSSGYVILKRPWELKPLHPRATGEGPRWHDQDPRMVRRRVWELAQALLSNATSKSAAFEFSNIAVSKNFLGSPHRDRNDKSVQYALSLGDFDGGGELCVEEGPFVVRAFTTRNRLVCIDGRFPHWVSGYSGERYSIIFFRNSGEAEPMEKAVHEV